HRYGRNEFAPSPAQCKSSGDKRVPRPRRGVTSTRRRAAQQALPKFPFRACIKRGEEFDLAAAERGGRHAIEVKEPVAGRRGQLPARRKYAKKMERIGPRERPHHASERSAPYLAQLARRTRQGELLARKAGDETAAADFPSRLEPAVDIQEIAPRRQPSGLPLQEAPEDDTVAKEQRARRVLEGGGFLLMQGRRAIIAARERPPSSLFQPCPPPGAAAALQRREQSAQARKTVGRDAACRRQFGERLFGLRAQQAR